MKISVIFFLLLTTYSCNNNKNETKTTDQNQKKDSGTIEYAIDSLHFFRPNGVDSVVLIRDLLSFKITKEQLEDIESTPGPGSVSKLLFNVGWSNIKDPTTMKLYMYPAKGHADFGRGKTPLALSNDNVYPTTELDNEFILGNYELNYQKVLRELKPGGVWSNFLHLRLVPTIKNFSGKPYLIFKVFLIASRTPSGRYLMKELKEIPAELKPSPPADPEP